MGLLIGDSVNTAFATRQSASRVAQAPSEERVSVGFGSGTISVPAAAAITVKRGVDGARELVPTLEETRANLRERLEEQRLRFEPDVDEESRRPIELDLQRARTDAATQTRQLLSGINEAATVANARAAGEAAEAAESTGPTLRIGGRTFEFGSPQTGNLLNILA